MCRFINRPRRGAFSFSRATRGRKKLEERIDSLDDRWLCACDLDFRHDGRKHCLLYALAGPGGLIAISDADWGGDAYLTSLGRSALSIAAFRALLEASSFLPERVRFRPFAVTFRKVSTKEERDAHLPLLDVESMGRVIGSLSSGALLPPEEVETMQGWLTDLANSG